MSRQQNGMKYKIEENEQARSRREKQNEKYMLK
jgi:hypothetical protein